MAYDVLEEQRDFDRAELAELWPPASIPVLRDGDQLIGETSIIISHVNGAHLVPSLEARKCDRLCVPTVAAKDETQHFAAHRV